MHRKKAVVGTSHEARVCSDLQRLSRKEGPWTKLVIHHFLFLWTIIYVCIHTYMCIHMYIHTHITSCNYINIIVHRDGDLHRFVFLILYAYLFAVSTKSPSLPENEIHSPYIIKFIVLSCFPCTCISFYSCICDFLLLNIASSTSDISCILLFLIL